MTEIGNLILKKCREHVKNGGLIVSGMNGVIAGDGGGHKSILEWEFKTNLKECCPIGATIVGQPVQIGVMELDASHILNVEETYCEGFIQSFDNEAANVSFNDGYIAGRSDAWEVRNALTREGVKIREEENPMEKAYQEMWPDTP